MEKLEPQYRVYMRNKCYINSVINNSLL